MRNLPRLVAYLPEPKTPKEMRSRLGNDVNRVKGIALRILAFLRNNDWCASL
jgi:hypothetical protein